MHSLEQVIRFRSPSGIERAWIITILAVLMGLLQVGCDSASKDDSSSPVDQGTIRLVIDFGDGKKKEFSEIPWQTDMTVLDAIRVAKKTEPELELKISGKGKMAMVMAIDGISRREEDGETKFWLFWVNDELSKVGCGTKKLQSGDTVLWKLGKYE